VLMRRRFFFFYLLFLTAWLFDSSCANIIPPAGGPRDTIPPRVISVSPADSTLNFTNQQIEIEFDEYVDLQEVANNLLFTPLFETNPEVTVRNKNITIRFRDTLDENTTYILKFGNAIRDFNEGNVLRDFTYTFSTGPALDSLSLRGRVELSETGGVDTTMVVVLHRNLYDSAVRDQRPRYVSRVKADGTYQFDNLPAGPFAIYAFTDPTNSRKYGFDKSQLFAFIDSPVRPALSDTVPVLYAYREVPQRPPVSNAQPTPQTGTPRLQFTPDPVTGTLDLGTPFRLNFTRQVRLDDTTAIQLFSDSLQTRESFRLQLDSTARSLSIYSTWKPGTLYGLVLGRAFASDTSGLRLLKEDTVFFNTRRLADYGEVSLRLKNIDLSARPVVQFLQNDIIVYSAPIPTGTITVNRLNAGEYSLRVLYDRNGNGVYDPGRFLGGRRAPERVVRINGTILVKGDWKNEFER
jgi:hypothetical protein